MNTELIKGFNDYTGEEAEKRQKVKGILARTFRKYGFELAETPIIEYEEFVKGENLNDEAVSDIFKLRDKGNRALALRYEFTFQLKRLAKGRKLPYKRYQIGEVFRDEPTSSEKARFRQFTQCDVDIVGLSEIKAREEAEILAVTDNVFRQLGIKNNILVGNRSLIDEIIDKEGIKKNKEQILREIDKLDKLSEGEIRENLKKFGAEKLLNIFKKPETYFKKYNAYNEIQNLKKYCSYYNVKINFLPSLVRGLSYYNGNVFEIKTAGKEMSRQSKISSSSKSNGVGWMKETICAGGSYEINGIQATGISFGLERINQLANVALGEERMLVISLGVDKEALKLAEKLRNEGKDITMYYGKPSKALEYANARKIKEVIFIGNEEVKKGKYKVRDMRTGRERFERL